MNSHRSYLSHAGGNAHRGRDTCQNVITRLKSGDALNELVRQQLTMSSSNPGSWFTHLEEIATTYEIDQHQALQMPWPKKQLEKLMQECGEMPLEQ